MMHRRALIACLAVLSIACEKRAIETNEHSLMRPQRDGLPAEFNSHNPHDVRRMSPHSLEKHACFNPNGRRPSSAMVEELNSIIEKYLADWTSLANRQDEYLEQSVVPEKMESGDFVHLDRELVLEEKWNAILVRSNPEIGSVVIKSAPNEFPALDQIFAAQRDVKSRYEGEIRAVFQSLSSQVR